MYRMYRHLLALAGLACAAGQCDENMCQFKNCCREWYDPQDQPLCHGSYVPQMNANRRRGHKFCMGDGAGYEDDHYRCCQPDATMVQPTALLLYFVEFEMCSLPTSGSDDSFEISFPSNPEASVYTMSPADSQYKRVQVELASRPSSVALRALGTDGYCVQNASLSGVPVQGGLPVFVNNCFDSTEQGVPCLLEPVWQFPAQASTSWAGQLELQLCTLDHAGSPHWFEISFPSNPAASSFQLTLGHEHSYKLWVEVEGGMPSSIALRSLDTNAICLTNVSLDGLHAVGGLPVWLDNPCDAAANPGVYDGIDCRVETTWQFPVFQTMELRRHRADFAGLLLGTSSGVLNFGQSGMDVAMELASQVATIDLRTAEASDEDDLATIRHLVESQPGGFDAVNSFVRQEVCDALAATQQHVQGTFGVLMQTLQASLGAAPAARATGMVPLHHLPAFPQGDDPAEDPASPMAEPWHGAKARGGAIWPQASARAAAAATAAGKWLQGRRGWLAAGTWLLLAAAVAALGLRLVIGLA